MSVFIKLAVPCFDFEVISLLVQQIDWVGCEGHSQNCGNFNQPPMSISATVIDIDAYSVSSIRVHCGFWRGGSERVILSGGGRYAFPSNTIYCISSIRQMTATHPQPILSNLSLYISSELSTRSLL